MLCARANAVRARPAFGLWLTQTTCAICAWARVRTYQCCERQTCMQALVHADHMHNLHVCMCAHVPMLCVPDLRLLNLWLPGWVFWIWFSWTCACQTCTCWICKSCYACAGSALAGPAVPASP